MKNRIVTHYYIKESKTDDKDLTPIYLRITINGTRAEISANRRVSISDWDKVTERVFGRSEQARTINAALTSLQNKVDKGFLILDDNDGWLKAKDLIDELRGRKADKVTLLEAFKHHLSEMKKLIGTDYAPKTVVRYEVVLRSLEEYLERIYFLKDIKLIDLDARFLESYNTFLKGSKGLHHNTVVKNIKIIKRVIHISMINSYSMR